MRDASGNPTSSARQTSSAGARTDQRRLGGPWLAALILVCAIVAVGDGSSRTFLPDDEPIAEFLEYRSSSSVYVFAFVSLPFCLLYAWGQGIRLSEGLLLWFILCTTAYIKNFSYISIPGTPLFITDLVLVVLLLSISRTAPWRKWLRIPYFMVLIVFWCAGVVAFASGLLGGGEVFRAARDAAMIVYTLFLVVAFVLIRSWRAVQRVLLFLALGTGLGTLNAAAWFVAQPGQRRYVLFGVYALCALVGVLVLWWNKVLPAHHGFILALLFSGGLILANARTTFVALAAMLGLILLVGVSGQSSALVPRVKLLAQISGLGVLVLIVGLHTDAGAAFFERASEELISGTLAYADDPNAQFRMLAWTEALGRFLASPIFGEGFGVPFTFAIWEEDVRPHNTFLTVLYKMGLVGFVPFLLLLWRFYWVGWRALRRSRNHSGAILLYVILLAHFGMCLYGGLNLLLESPFLAAIFWILMGLGIRSMQLLRDDELRFMHSRQPAPLGR